MRSSPLIVFAACAVVLLAGLEVSRAQHFDVLIQQKNGTVVTGTGDFDHSEWLLGLRAFNRDFGATYAITNPGFVAIAANSPDLPPGASALPGSTNLSWDFLPMTITEGNNSLSQNLFYWDGQDTDGIPGLTPNDVAFGPLPGPNYTLSLYDKFNAKFSADGANAVVPGGIIATTQTNGRVHVHLPWYLENGGGDRADGLYLLAMRFRVTGLENSLPVFMIFGTSGSSVEAEDDAAYPWVLQQLDLPGDYNRNGVVDAADYTVWRDTLDQTGAGMAADGSGNELVDADDYDVWKQHFGAAAELRIADIAGAGGVGATGVPEPSAKLIASVASSAASFVRRRSGRARRAPGLTRPRC